MNEDNKLDLVAEILEVDSIKSDDMLDNYEMWDSMAVLSVLAMLEESFNVIDVSGETISKCKTVKQILNLMEN